MAAEAAQYGHVTIIYEERREDPSGVDIVVAPKTGPGTDAGTRKQGGGLMAEIRRKT